MIGNIYILPAYVLNFLFNFILIINDKSFDSHNVKRIYHYFKNAYKIRVGTP